MCRAAGCPKSAELFKGSEKLSASDLTLVAHWIGSGGGDNVPKKRKAKEVEDRE